MPALTPVATPSVLPIVAIPVEPLIQVPLPDELFKVLVAPAHTFEPVIEAGNGLTVTTFVANWQFRE